MSTPETPSTPEFAHLLDWRKLVPEQRYHECDCSHCEIEIEPIRWPMLIVIRDGEVAYITDKYLAVRADHAPIPDGYEGSVHDAEDGPRIPAHWRADVSDEPPNGVHFRHQIVTAIDDCGWRLRRLVADVAPHAQAPDHVRTYGVVTATGDHVGWAISSKPVAIDDDYATAEWTKPYAEVVTPPGEKT